MIPAPRADVIETKLFTSLVGDYLSDAEYAALQQALADNPDAGEVIRGASRFNSSYELSPDGTRFLMIKLPGALGVVPNVIVVRRFNGKRRIRAADSRLQGSRRPSRQERQWVLAFASTVRR
jgi:hypothetical protein